MEDQNDLARSAARAFKENVVTGGKGDNAELAAQPLLCTGMLKLMVGTTNKSMAAMSGAWLRKKVRHPWLGGPRRLTTWRRSTERSQSRA
jgi:hypothetical protein